MGTEEKKFKLDELPDNTGSEPDKINHPTPKKAPLEPRLQSFKTLGNTEKAAALSQSWFFDKQIKRWGWLIALLVLLALEKSGHMDQFDVKRKEYQAAGDKASEFVLDVFNLEFLLAHPLYLAILIPLFFKFHGNSKYFFEITFQGINAVKSIAEKNDGPQRVSLKWDEIVSVEKIIVEDRPVLQIHGAKGPSAQLIWDIEIIKKKVIKQILAGLIAKTHPFRIFIEKEVA